MAWYWIIFHVAVLAWMGRMIYMLRGAQRFMYDALIDRKFWADVEADLDNGGK